jgi:hypothetical protein
MAVVGYCLGPWRSRVIFILNLRFSITKLISVSAKYKKKDDLFDNSMRGKLFSPFPLLKSVLISVTTMTGEKLERPESQNDRNAGTTIKQERSESWNDWKNLSHQNNSCANILALLSTLPEDARRTELSLDFVYFFARFAKPIYDRKDGAPIYWRCYCFDEPVCHAMPSEKVIAL